ncbi:MAG TPA: hypothetical protein VLF66_08620, partial [Thermoanaerobaculia bacterium]|nr:hypothetical protein [Thermoanaerobaculia bacterium]
REHLEAGCVPCLLARHDLARAIHGEGEEALARAYSLRERRPSAPEERSRLLLSVGRRLERLAWVEELEERVAPGLLRELEGLPRAERPHAIRHERRYQLLGFARYLTRLSREEARRDVARAEDLGELAMEAADSLDSRVYLPRTAADAGALAWAALGNARRVLADPVAAERAFRMARERLAAGTGAAEVRAEFLSLLGSLRRAQAAFAESRKVLAEALALAERAGEVELQKRLILKLAKSTGEGGDPEGAVALLGRSAQLVDQPVPEDLSHYRLQALAAWLAELDRPAEARAAFEQVKELWLSRMPGAADRERLFWLGARISWAEGDLDGADEQLQGVRDAFRELGAHYDFALATLDQALLYLEQGRTADVRRLASEMLPVFTSRSLHRHALAALVLFQRAAEAEEATAAWVRELARYLRHARGNPLLRFPGAPAGEEG